MYNPDEVMVEIKKYMLKLKKIIQCDATFTFFTRKLVSKKKIDDILCCIEGALPHEYAEYLKKYGINSIQSNIFLQKVHQAIKNKFLFSSDSYLVDHTNAEKMLNLFINHLREDLNLIARTM